jgi:hypothetical protein
MMRKALALSCVLILVAGSAWAGQRDMIASCYGMLKIEAPKPALQREIFVVIDQTTPVDEPQQRNLVNDVLAKFVPDTAVTVLTFSAFIGGHYADIVFSGALDRLPIQDERDDIPKSKLKQLDQCLSAQTQYAQSKVTEAMMAGFGKPTDAIARSDIISTLKDISGSVVNSSPAAQRDVLLVSDMLENSTISSFYSKNSVKLIDPKAELNKVGEFGDFGGANIYIAGAGSIITAGKKQVETYRDPKTMDALERFWREFFIHSNANLAAFGKPSLMGAY